MSTRRYLPASGTAGLERSLVRGNNLLPAPPPMTMARVRFWRDDTSIVRQRSQSDEPGAFAVILQAHKIFVTLVFCLCAALLDTLGRAMRRPFWWTACASLSTVATIRPGSPS